MKRMSKDIEIIQLLKEYNNKFGSKPIKENKDIKVINLLREYNSKYELLNEAKSKFDILVKKLGASEENAKLLDETFGSLSVIMANKIGEHYLKTAVKNPSGDKYSTIKEVLSQEPFYEYPIVIEQLQLIKNYIEFELDGKLEFEESDGTKGTLKDLNLYEIFNKARDWEKKSGGKINYIENEENIVEKFDDGFYWVNLGAQNCDEEGKRMGHCGRSGKGNLYSLRSYTPLRRGFTRNESHLTAAIDDDGIVYQLKGGENTKPKKEYHPYIVDYVEDDNGKLIGQGLLYIKRNGKYLVQEFSREYSPKNDFKLEDLDEEVLIQLYKDRKELFKGSTELIKKMESLGIKIGDINFPTEFEIEILYSSVHHYIEDDELAFSTSYRRMHLSEVVLERDEEGYQSYLDHYHDYAPGTKTHEESYMFRINLIVDKYLNEGLKNYIRKLIIDEINQDQRDPTLNKKQYETMSLSSLIYKTEMGQEIMNYMFHIQQDLIIDSMHDVYYKTLISCLKLYAEGGYVSDSDGSIFINGHLDNLVDMKDPDVIQAYEEVESESGDFFVNEVFRKLIEWETIPRTYWNRPNPNDVKIEVNRYNELLYEDLERYETNMNESKDIKVINLLREYNSRYELLNEAKSKLDILVKKFGMEEANAKVLDDIFGPLSIWMANKLGEYYSNMYNEDYPTPKVAISRLYLRASSYRSQFTSIKDYIVVGLNGNKSSLDNLDYKEIYDKSKEWHDSLNLGDAEIDYKETHPIILDFRNNNGEGYYWVSLETKNSTEECKRMGHCGRSSKGELYSLRSDRKMGKFRYNKSHLTAAIGEDGIIYQLKGPKNSKPKEEYHPYILPLFEVQDEDDDYLIKGFGREYASRQDFRLEDLPMETLKTIYKTRPDIFKGNYKLKEKMKELGVDIELEPLPSEFYIDIDYEYAHFYIENDEVAYDKGTYGGDRQYMLSEVVLGRDFSGYYAYLDINYSDYTPEEKTAKGSQLGKIKLFLDKYVYDGLKSQMRRMVMENLTDDEKKRYENTPLHDLLNETEIGQEIVIGALYDTQQELLVAKMHSVYYNNLMDAFREYVVDGGEVDDDNMNFISISGDLSNLVDLDDPEVIEIYTTIEEQYEDMYTDMVFERLVFEDLISKPRWNRPDPRTLELNVENFNKLLNEKLNELENEY